VLPILRNLLIPSGLRELCQPRVNVDQVVFDLPPFTVADLVR
jgi:hypothetical protein